VAEGVETNEGLEALDLRTLGVHRKLKLTVFGLRLLVERIELEGWPVARAAGGS
jgi:hypothetical protein